MPSSSIGLSLRVTFLNSLSFSSHRWHLLSTNMKCSPSKSPKTASRGEREREQERKRVFGGGLRGYVVWGWFWDGVFRGWMSNFRWWLFWVVYGADRLSRVVVEQWWDLFIVVGAGGRRGEKVSWWCHGGAHNFNLISKSRLGLDQYWKKAYKLGIIMEKTKLEINVGRCLKLQIIFDNFSFSFQRKLSQCFFP